MEAVAQYNEIRAGEKQEQQVEAAPAGVDEAEGDEDFEEAKEEPEGYVPPADEDTTSIMSIVPNDHDRIKGLYRRYKDPTDTPHQRQLLALQLLRELAVHCAAEEAVLYPAVAEAVEQHMSEHAVDEHDSLKLFSADLEGMTFGDQAYEDKMHQLMETFLEHIHEEEHVMLPALRDELEEAQLRDLGRRFEAAKQHMPTRAHPDVKHTSHVDDATVLRDAAKDAAQFNGTPPAIGSPSTEVLREEQ
ncbi:hypothetical protein OEZ85_001883 [Tetradesmus obliquus]|uniref:Hemerythrin-like domain-containing protein n=1 Tax=Tetradesmus obliquus TaxID=3088 RepID=A0ABY8U176_TETOB|nr:hypothetical protein OEZ85_001883 [Tetradesmus obliquus]